MDNQELRKLLEELDSEIEQTKSVDEKGRELLRDLASDISELLARSEGGQAGTQTSLLGRLEDSISYLEVTHPTLTQTLTRVLETLSNAGI
jgi:hypothetical protein